MTSIKALIDRLLSAVPGLRPVYEEHLADNDELLPHVFFGDVTRYAQENADSDSGSVDELLRVLEEALGDADPEVREVIQASFLEDLLPEEAALRSLEPRMGPNLRKALADMSAQ